MRFRLTSSIMNQTNSISEVNTITIDQSVFKADISVGIVFSITSPKWSDYYNTTDTLQYIARSVNEYMISNLPRTFTDYFIADISTEPLIISYNNSKEQESNSYLLLSIVTIDNSIYLLQSCSSQDILDIFQFHTPTIAFKTSNGDCSCVSGIFSTLYSNPTDRYSTLLSIEEITSFTCIPVDHN
jgi:hypothetical protein